MRVIHIISLASLLLLSVTSCDRSSNDTKVVPLSPTEDHVPRPQVSESGNHGYYDYELTDPNEYAEKKTTNELEEEYYDVFGDDFLYNVDDEEYEAAEAYEDYDDDYEDY